MFEILKALRDLNAACMAHGRDLRWEIRDEPGVGPVLHADVELTEVDKQFVDDMQALFAPVQE